MDDRLGVMDPTRSDSMIQDVPLGSWFERPIPISTFDWSTDSAPTFDFDINPWELFFSQPQNAARVNNYKLMQCNMHIKILINGNAFFYGRAIASYNPLHDTDDLSKRTRYGIDADLVGLSQRPHIYIDPTNSQGGEMTLPFYWYKNAIDMYETDISRMGSLRLKTINPLKHANGANDAVSITVFAWATDVKLSVPCNEDNYILNPQSGDEYGTGVISKPAAAVATVAASLKRAPWIGPFALATQIGATAVSQIATIFGFSRPAQVETGTMRIVNKGTMANSNMDDDVHKLSLDVKQELTIDSRVDGRNGEDEFDILTMAQHESYWTQFAWNVGSTQNTLLWNCGVNPSCVRRNVTDPAGNEIHLGACAYASLPFTFWRGSMRYRFQVVCSKYHRGRLLITYDPFETSAARRTNTSYSTIVDISDKTDFTIDVGWGQGVSWLRNLPYDFSENFCSSTAALFWNPEFNGTLSVSVLNELTVPDSTIDNNISINVFATVCDDFEVAVPDATYMSRVRFSNADDVVPQSGEENNMNSVTDTNTDNVEVSDEIGVAAKTDPSDHMKMVHFGEPFKSFRPLLKRYMKHEIVALPGNNASSNVAPTLGLIQRQNMPFIPGFTDYPNNGTDPTKVPYPVTVGLESKSYARAQMTHLKYVTACFGGWKGAIRYSYDLMSVGCCGTMKSFVVNRYSSCGPENQYLPETDIHLPAALDFFKESTLFEGGIVQSPTTNSVISVEYPYYCPFRFTPARMKSDFSSTPITDIQPCHKLGFAGNWGLNKYISTYVSAGEDFTASFYLSTPIIYLEPSVPA